MLREIERIKPLGLIILSALFLSLSFPDYNLGILAYVAFIPLFLALENVTKKEAFTLAYLCGLFFFGITLFWIRHVSVLGYTLLILILSVFFGIFGLFFLSAIRYPLSAIFAAPALWVILEYIRSNLFGGFGWALLGHSQYLNLPIIQISDITGGYGVSFFVMMVNIIIYRTIKNGARKSIAALLTGAAFASIVLSYGHFRLNEKVPAGQELTVSLIQGNIPQHMKWDGQYKDYIFNVYERLTKDASRYEPDLIVWPETALPGLIEEIKLLRGLKDLAKDVRAHLLAGAPSYGSSGGEEEFNSAILLSKEGEIVGRYDKVHLVPFGEYVPFARYTEFIRNFIDKPIGDFTAGREYVVFELEGGARFGVLICFEDIFPGLVRNFVKRGADFMVNITNDAWFMKTAAPYQHAQSSVFRAVENRVPVLRAANTGLSCFIDRCGRIIDTVSVNGEEIFITGQKTKKIELYKDRTFYTKFGDIFTFFCAAVFIISGGRNWLKRYL